MHTSLGVLRDFILQFVMLGGFVFLVAVVHRFGRTGGAYAWIILIWGLWAMTDVLYRLVMNGFFAPTNLALEGTTITATFPFGRHFECDTSKVLEVKRTGPFPRKQFELTIKVDLPVKEFYIGEKTHDGIDEFLLALKKANPACEIAEDLL